MSVPEEGWESWTPEVWRRKRDEKIARFEIPCGTTGCESSSEVRVLTGRRGVLREHDLEIVWVCGEHWESQFISGEWRQGRRRQLRTEFITMLTEDEIVNDVISHY